MLKTYLLITSSQGEFNALDHGSKMVSLPF